MPEHKECLLHLDQTMIGNDEVCVHFHFQWEIIFILPVSSLGHHCVLNMLLFPYVNWQALTEKLCSDELLHSKHLGVSDMTKDINSLWYHSRACILLHAFITNSRRLFANSDTFTLATLVLTVLSTFIRPKGWYSLLCTHLPSFYSHYEEKLLLSREKIFWFCSVYILNETQSSCNFTSIFNLLDY